MPITSSTLPPRAPRRPRRRLSAPTLVALGALLLACSGSDGDVQEKSVTFDAATGSAADMASPAPPAAPQAAPPPSYRTQSVAAMAGEEAQAGGQAQASQPGPSGAAATTMLIRTGSAAVEVRSVDEAIGQVRQLAARLGGYVANSSLQGGEEQVRSATLELKIPAARFDEAVSGLAPLGEVESVNVNTQDVGEEFTDLTARVSNARRLEERLITLLAQRTGRLEDVLAVERELARVREEIERHEGRLRYLGARVSMSTLSVMMHEPYPLVGGRPGGSPIADAFRQAWRNFVGFLAAFIASLGVLLPLAVIAAAVVWVARRLLARRTPRGGPPHAAPVAPPPAPGPTTPL